jgi:hypothetical protein
MPSDRPIAARTFSNRDGPVEMEIYAPQQLTPSESQCRYVISWSNGTVKDRRASGGDSLQALLLAISSARVTMMYPKIAQRDESLKFHANGDLGLDLIPVPDPDPRD